VTYWQNIAVVGKPVAYGIGFLMLVLVAFTGGVASSIVTVAHEGGHMMAALASGRGVTGFELIEGNEVTGGGGTRYTRIRGTGVSDIVIKFVGYATPPLAGLGGAHAIAHGNAWGVLVIGVVCCSPSCSFVISIHWRWQLPFFYLWASSEH
jgi:hypothetical protein